MNLTWKETILASPESSRQEAMEYVNLIESMCQWSPPPGCIWAAGQAAVTLILKGTF